ncbi:uncharacterized protein LOC142356825 isoform X2 [Convolutriloba macropyga]|uniref:uncharacterized protein LOC142356825 isoform X2 n=1 Tax=Convolutriloba macropyga TaxID=536237 RepID=UPI003F522B63
MDVVYLLLLSFLSSADLVTSSYGNRHTWEPRQPPSPEWESLIFWIANGIGGFGQACREHSDFYCLEGYSTQPFNQSFPSGRECVQSEGSSACAGVALGYDPAACKAWFTVLVQEKWPRINMIDIRDPTDCCEAQTEKYMVNGLQNRGMTPDEYMHKLTDYDNEDKPLNFLSAMYIPWLCQNILLDVGFGPGPLRRDHHPNIAQGAPYIIAGKEFPDVGIPHIRTKYINFEDPGSELTFHWFKHNIMCEDHPWICKSSKLGTKMRLSSGNKKSRRKNRGN